MRLSGRILSKLLSYVPRGDSVVYDYCRRYVFDFDGENNADMAVNGELMFMRQRLPTAQVVFDVGANVGQWSKAALSINPSIALHCFEPSLPTFNELMTNQFSPSVTCNNFGLSSSNRKAELFIFGEGSGLNSLYRREGLELSSNLAPQSSSESVTLSTLDDYCEDRSVPKIDFLKVDVEGHELDVFIGAREQLRQYKIRTIQFEYGGCNIDARVFLKDIFDFFSEYPDYRFYKILPGSLRPAQGYDQRLEDFQYQNWAVICG